MVFQFDLTEESLGFDHGVDQAVDGVVGARHRVGGDDRGVDGHGVLRSGLPVCAG